MVSRYYHKLVKSGVVYLGGHASNSIDEIALKLLAHFALHQNFVPHFADLFIVATPKRLSHFRKLVGKEANKVFQLYTPDDLPKRHRPDVIWVDNNSLQPEQVRKLFIKYNSIPTIYTGCKPGKRLQLIADTREQLPIYKGAECKRMKLEVGDYTTDKLFNKFHVERKSLQDLYGSIVQGHARFRRELIRAGVHKIKLVIFVEGTKRQFVLKDFPKGKDRNMKSETLEKIINTVESRYMCEVVWCSDRDNLRRKMYNRLKLEETKI